MPDRRFAPRLEGKGGCEAPVGATNPLEVVVYADHAIVVRNNCVRCSQQSLKDASGASQN